MRHLQDRKRNRKRAAPEKLWCYAVGAPYPRYTRLTAINSLLALTTCRDRRSSAAYRYPIILLVYYASYEYAHTMSEHE